MYVSAAGLMRDINAQVQVLIGSLLATDMTSTIKKTTYAPKTQDKIRNV